MCVYEREELTDRRSMHPTMQWFQSWKEGAGSSFYGKGIPHVTAASGLCPSVAVCPRDVT